jgi:hypothetical protein
MDFSRLPVIAAACALALVSCSRKTVSVQTDVDAGSEAFQFVMPNRGEVTDPVHGKEIWFAIGAIAGENKVAANGIAQVHYMEDGTSLVTLQMNIHQAVAGLEYHGYLVNSAGDRVDIGTLDSFSGVRHRLNYDAKRDLREYATVEIALNKTGSTEAGTLQAKGTLSERKRNP